MARSWFLPLLLLLPLATTNCVGCGDAEVTCDDQGRCVVCDAFGCRDADETDDDGTGAATGNPSASSTANGSGSGDATSTTTTGGDTTASTGTGQPTCDPLVVTCGCNDTSECQNGLHCIGGVCLDGCNFDYECGPDKVCVDGLCAGECSPTALCETGYKCDEGVCVVDPANPECDGPEDCNGMVCVGGFCTTLCDDNADCEEGELCNATTGACFEDTTPTPLCGGAVSCVGAGQMCYPDGYCHYPCATETECKLIDVRFVACDGFCKTDVEVNPECDLDHPCPGGASCISNTCVP